jgi:ABC-2 type transport system permease protein
MFIAPLLMVVALGLGIGALNTLPERIRIDVVDHDKSPLSARFLENLRATNTTLVLCPFDNTEDDFCALEDDAILTEARAVERLVNNTSLVLIQIPLGFEARLEAGEPVSIVYRSNESASAPGYILQAVRAVVQRVGGALVAAEVGVMIAEDFEGTRFTSDNVRMSFRQQVYDRAAELWVRNAPFVDFHQTEVQATSSTQVGFGQSIPGMATMFSMFFVFGGMINLISERQNGTFQRLLILPLTRSQILSGKIVMYFTLGMMEFAIIFALGALLGVNFGRDPLALVLVMVAFTICMTALTFALSTLLRTDQQGYALLNLLGLTLAPLGGAWWPLEIVPEFMQIIGHLSPVAWAMDAFRLLIFENGSLADIPVNLGVLLALAGVFFTIAIWRFKYE